jgi:hypothetical protein
MTLGHQTRLVRIVLAGGAGAAILLLAACGSSSGSTGAGPTSTVTVTAPPTGSTGGSSPTPTSSTTPAAPTQAPVDTRCHTSELSLSVGDSEGAAGTIYTTFVFTNISSRSCTMFGFPGVSYLNGSTQVAAPATRSGIDPALITLAPGATAHSVVANSNIACGTPTMAPTVRIYPPDETAPIDLAAAATGSFAVCATRVQAVDAGSSS